VNSVAYSPDGQHITSGSIDTTVRIWDAKTGAAVGMPLVGHMVQCYLLLTLPMGNTSSLDPSTPLSESGIPRLVLQLEIL
jgi:WD40 repeat protein